MRRATVTLLSSCAVLSLLFALPLFAARPETPPPGQGKYVIVLWQPGTPVPGHPEKRMKRVDEPDVAKHGGRLLHKRSNLRVVFLPFADAKELRKHEAVAYIQRLWMGEPTDDWDEQYTPASTGPRVQSDADTNLTWGPKSYAYDGSGNIKQIGTDEYTYDSAGRLIRATVSGKTETYEYDSFGNLTKKSVAGGTPVEIPVDPGSNRIMGPAYDAAGNMTTSAKADYEYDSLNMLVSTTPSLGTRRILYDANDERTGWIIDQSTSRWTIRDFDGQIIREYKGEHTGAWMDWFWELDEFRGEGQLLGGESQRWSYLDYQAGGTRHYHLDHLGSVRMVTNEDGRSLSEHDYYPYGANITPAFQEPLNWGDPHIDGMRFAGHWRDFYGIIGSETNEYIDNMHARAYDPALGRFLSVDPVLDPRALRRPQSWNRYSYVLNNPLRYTDPTGMLWFKLDDKWTYLKDTDEITQVAANKDGTTTTTVIKGVKFGLVFNGTGLTQLREDGTTRTLPAVSGRVSGWGEINPGQQGERNRGPIPEGTYTFNRSDIQTFDGPNYDINLLATALGRGWRGGTYAWGTQRVFLSPMPGTNTRGRYGFSIHGGAVPGSAGCIDLCDMVNVFFSEIPRSANEIPVDVDYSDPLP